MNKNFLSGFLAGAALGFLVGLLSAPEEGVTYRDKFFNLVEDEVDKINYSIRRLVELFRKKEGRELSLEEELH